MYADAQRCADVTVVVLSYNRAAELRRTLQRLLALPERPPLVVVDNASSDGTAAMLRDEFATLEVVRCPRNFGAAGRNAGVARVRTPYVAFCDDDTAWLPGALTRAAALLDRHRDIAALVGRVRVGERAHDDPVCALLAASPLPSHGLPGPALLGLLAGASVMRVDAYRQVGGFSPLFFIGGEETLMALDYAALGWAIVYVEDVITRHWPSPLRDRHARSWLLLRNAIWTAWLRLPFREAVRASAQTLRRAARDGLLLRVLYESLRGCRPVLRARRPLPAVIAAQYRLVEDFATRWERRQCAVGEAVPAGGLSSTDAQ